MPKVETLKCGKDFEISLPDEVDVLSMKTPIALKDPENAILRSLGEPINSPRLDKIIKNKLQKKSNSKAVVVISDNTRPVPYKSRNGILLPVINKLLENGVDRDNILILVATGTHRALSDNELKEMINPEVFEIGIEIKNHNCKTNLVNLGKTSRGSKVLINKDYMEADIRILTGLVESHFMAGTSGGRKSVCPGIIGEESTYIFHGAEMLDSPNARDLVLNGNPCHEEALEIAKMAGVDFITNVTLDHQFNITGVFSGELEKAHQAAVKHIMDYVAIPIEKRYDLVITHAGFVGINHYQSAKVAVISKPLLKPDGKLIIAANITDDDPVGSNNYRCVLYLLKKFGVKKFKRLILSHDWTFIPEQWQVQMWSKLFKQIRQENLIYYSPFLTKKDYSILPGKDGNIYLPEEKRYINDVNLLPEFIERAVNIITEDYKERGKKLKTAYLIDGPYGVPIQKRC